MSAEISEASFNSSQVGYKPQHLNPLDAQARFQFLIGRLQTKIMLTPPNDDYRVSIPHRQATNATCRNYVMRQRAFQFLIGRLQTPHSPFSVPVDAGMFQFLIGRLQTTRCISGMSIPPRFQFLIGRLQTVQVPIEPFDMARFNSSQVGYKLVLLVRQRQHQVVSIPHRQATNPEPCWT